MGNIWIGTLTEQSAAYVASYVTKKMTQKHDPRLKGRHPEFTRQSNRPGLGAGFMDEVASTILENRLEVMEDVPVALSHGRKSYPLGRYLRRRLRQRIGRSANAPESVIEKYKEELSPMLQAAKVEAPRGLVELVFRQKVIEAGEGQVQKIEGRHRFYRKEKKL